MALKDKLRVILWFEAFFKLFLGLILGGKVDGVDAGFKVKLRNVILLLF